MDWLGPVNPFFVAFLLRVLSAIATLTVLRGLFARYGDQLSPSTRNVFLVLLLFNWCLYYNGVRFSSENWGGLAAIAGLLCYPLYRPGPNSFTSGGGRWAFVAGALFGLSFLFRYQMALFVAGFYLWYLLCYRKEWQGMLLSLAGGLAVLGVCYPLIYWLYGEWTSPAWNYLSANLIEGKAAGYGTLPWWAYLKLVVLRGIPPLGLLYLAGTCYYLYRFRRDPLSWAIGVFLLVHSLIGRKDIRFLYPLIPLLPVLMAGAWQAVLDRFAHLLNFTCVNKLAWVCVLMNTVLLAIVVFRPAATEIATLRFLYEAYPGPATLTGPDARVLLAEDATGRFYLRPSHRIKSGITNELGPCAPSPCLYLTRTRETPRPPDNARLVYSDRPESLLPYVPFGLLDREKWWYIYAVE